MQFDRRTVVQSMCTSVWALTTKSLAAGEGKDVVAKTDLGPVRGIVRGGVAAFLGVPYGTGTTGTGRFRPARRPAPWREPRAALEYGPACPQSKPGVSQRRMVERESEDCLTLNVWTPALADGGKRPVMVWFHGGGLWALSASGASQAGDGLARNHDVVMVSANHRIGLLGYLELGGLDSSFAGSSHMGSFDLIMVLKWVRDNVEQFGGDPDNVTIMGQSGGGQKVSLLMAMPAAKGLFHKAIIQSGPMPLSISADYARELTTRLLEKLGLRASQAAELQTLPLDRIMTGYYKLYDELGGYGTMGIVTNVAPAVDGEHLPQHPFWFGASPWTADVPLLTGSTRTEMAAYNLADDPDAYKMSYEQIGPRLRPLFGDDAERIATGYRQRHPAASPWEVYSLIKSDWPTRLFTLRIADAKSRQRGAPVHVYRMDWTTNERGGLLMSPHAIDIPFALDTVHALKGVTQLEERRRMADQMSRAWSAFARTGNPSHRGLPAWPSYDERGRATMLFDLKSRLVRDPDGEDISEINRGIDAYTLVGGGLQRRAGRP